MCGSSECQRPASLSVTLRSRGAHLGEELLLRQSAVAEQIDLVDQALGRPCPGEQCLWFYVLEGELTIWVEGKTVVAGAGSLVFGPRDVPSVSLLPRHSGVTIAGASVEEDVWMA